MADKKLEIELQKAGFDKRSAKVYLATLELGPSPVQKISQRAGVPRATTYLVLDDLQNRGLVSTFRQGKKSYFAAESPQRLSHLVASKEKELAEQKSAVNDLISELNSRAQTRPNHSSRPIVRFYEGPDALKGFIRDNLRQAQIKKEALGIISYDQAEQFITKASLSWDDLVKHRQRKGVKRRIIYTWKEREPDKNRVAKNAVYVPYQQFPCQADITIAGHRVAFVPYDEPFRAVAIEDATIARNMKALFEFIWQSAQSPTKKRQKG